MKRILTAILLIPIVLYTVLWADYWVLFGVICLVSLICYREYNTIAAGFGFGAPGIMGYGAGLFLLAWHFETWPIVLVIALVAMTAAMRDENLSSSLPRAALLLFGVVYIFGAWKAAIPLWAENRHWLMYALLLNWAGDTGAYYVGRLIGRHKMAPRVSPKKSWEGAVASVITSVAGGGAYLHYYIPTVPIEQVVALTVVANIAGQLGDLAESAMKRGANVKDSSGMLPGHGGLLDRVDSSLFTLPVIYIWLKLASL